MSQAAGELGLTPGRGLRLIDEQDGERVYDIKSAQEIGRRTPAGQLTRTVRFERAVEGAPSASGQRAVEWVPVTRGRAWAKRETPSFGVAGNESFKAGQVVAKLEMTFIVRWHGEDIRLTAEARAEDEAAA